MVTIIEIHGLVLPPLVLTSSIGGLSIRQKLLSILACVTLARLILIRPDAPVVALVRITRRHAIGLAALKACVKCVLTDYVFLHLDFQKKMKSLVALSIKKPLPREKV